LQPENEMRLRQLEDREAGARAQDARLLLKHRFHLEGQMTVSDAMDRIQQILDAIRDGYDQVAELVLSQPGMLRALEGISSLGFAGLRAIEPIQTMLDSDPPAVEDEGSKKAEEFAQFTANLGELRDAFGLHVSVSYITRFGMRGKLLQNAHRARAQAECPEGEGLETEAPKCPGE